MTDRPLGMRYVSDAALRRLAASIRAIEADQSALNCPPQAPDPVEPTWPVVIPPPSPADRRRIAEAIWGHL